MKRIPSQAARPRYAVVAKTLIDDILSGRYAVGTALPTEHALCKHFDISRHTAREAIRRLQALGLVTRRAGVGTIVITDHIAQRYMQVGDTVADLYQYAQDMDMNVLDVSDIEADDDTATLLGCPIGQTWTRLQGLRGMDPDALPMALTDVYITQDYRDVLGDVEGAGLPIWSLIEARYGVIPSEVRQQITAITLAHDDAEKLQATPGEPALRITRHYLSDPIGTYEVAINLYPAGRFSYSNTLRIDPTAPLP